MTPEQKAEVDRIEALANAATEGPWNWLEARTLNHIETNEDCPSGAGRHICSLPRKDTANADFIYSSRTAIPCLIALIREQAAELERLQDKVLRQECDKCRIAHPVASLCDECHECKDCCSC